MKNKSNRISLSASYSTPLGASLSALAASQPNHPRLTASTSSSTTLSGFTSFSSYASSSSWLSTSTSLSSLADVDLHDDCPASDAYWAHAQHDLLETVQELEEPVDRPRYRTLWTRTKSVARGVAPWDYVVAAVFAFHLWLLLCAFWGHGSSSISVISCSPVSGDQPLQQAAGNFEDGQAAYGVPAPEVVLQLPLSPVYDRGGGMDGHIQRHD